MIKLIVGSIAIFLACFTYAFLIDVAFVLCFDRFSTSDEFLAAYLPVPLAMIVVVLCRPNEPEDVETEDAE